MGKFLSKHVALTRNNNDIVNAEYFVSTHLLFD